MTHAPRYHKEMMAILKKGGHIPCPDVHEVDMTDAATTDTPPPTTSKDKVSVVANKMAIIDEDKLFCAVEKDIIQKKKAHIKWKVAGKAAAKRVVSKPASKKVVARKPRAATLAAKAV